LFGLTVWLYCEKFHAKATVPPQFFGLFASTLGMVIGSLVAPSARHGHHTHA
jgi:hypothetical protein